jgi:hypothetical protein
MWVAQNQFAQNHFELIDLRLHGGQLSRDCRRYLRIGRGRWCPGSGWVSRAFPATRLIRQRFMKRCQFCLGIRRTLGLGIANLYPRNRKTNSQNNWQSGNRYSFTRFRSHVHHAPISSRFRVQRISLHHKLKSRRQILLLH